MIGERLEEARKRKGISIREAAEATKIRGDYLLSMEDNSFEIALPQIYIRGFIKNYARFLQLDPNKILTDYDAHQLGRHSRVAATAARSGRESLGHVEIPDEGAVVTEPTEQDGPEPELRLNIDRGAEARRPTPPPPTLERKGMSIDRESWNESKAMYIKIGVVFGAFLAICIVLVLLVKLLTGTGEEAAPGTSVTATAPATTPATTPAGQALTDRFTVSATDSVTLIIEQTIDRKRLYSGTLNAGEKISLDKQGPVSIRFTNGSAIQIEKNGQQLRPGQAGVGRTVVD